MYILSQVLVILSDLFFIISVLKNKKKNLIFYLAISTILFGLHYACLSAWTGCVIAMVELVFLIVMYILERKNKTQYSTHVSTITIILIVVLSVLTWDSWWSALPMVAMVIYLIAMMFSNVIIVKSGTFIRLILNGAYMLLLKSYFGAGLTIVLIICAIIGIINDVKIKNQNTKTSNQKE